MAQSGPWSSPRLPAAFQISCWWMLFLWGKSRLIDGLLCCDMAIWHGMVRRHQGPVIKGVTEVSRTVHSLRTGPLSESLHTFPSYPPALWTVEVWQLAAHKFWLHFASDLALNDNFRGVFWMPLDSVLIRWSQENPAWHLVLTTTIKTLSGHVSDDHVCHCRNEGICPFYHLFNLKYV